MDRLLLVTGGSGFIGANLVDYLLGQGVDTVSVDIAPPQNQKRLSIFRPVNICNFVALTRVIQ